MGGLGRASCRSPTASFVVGALALAAIPPFAGFFSKDAILGAARERRHSGLDPLGGGRDRRVPHRALHLPPPLHRLLGRDDALRPRAPAPEALRGRRWRWRGRSAILAVLSFVGGWIQVPWGWDLVNEWIEPVAESAAEADGHDAPLLGPRLARPRRRGHLASPGAGTGGRATCPSERAGACPWAARTLEHKFYFDEAYDLAFYEPASREALFLTQLRRAAALPRLAR